MSEGNVLCVGGVGVYVCLCMCVREGGGACVLSCGCHIPNNASYTF